MDASNDDGKYQPFSIVRAAGMRFGHLPRRVRSTTNPTTKKKKKKWYRTRLDIGTAIIFYIHVKEHIITIIVILLRVTMEKKIDGKTNTDTNERAGETGERGR